MNIRDEIAQVAIRYLPGEETQMFMANIDLILSKYAVTKAKNEIVEYEGANDEQALKMFFVTKKVKGCSDNTIAYYANVIRQFRSKVKKPFAMVVTNDIRLYLAQKQIYDGNSKTSLNNQRRVLRSLFKFLTDENIVLKNPTLAVENIREEKRIKKPFTPTEIEKIRSACRTQREKTIVEMLLSTGCRVSELVSINVEDIDLAAKTIEVIGKGNKERIVFLNAKAEFELKKLIFEKNIEQGPVFCGKNKKRLTKTMVEKIVKTLGIEAGVSNCHPHRFRRTMASLALNRGMSIDQVGRLLGHADISTTTIYAITDNESLKEAHRKYVI